MPKDTTTTRNAEADPLTHVIGMLDTAGMILRGGQRSDGDQELAHACWRLADAGALLRQIMEARGITGELGLDYPSGRGAMLPHLAPAQDRTRA